MRCEDCGEKIIISSFPLKDTRSKHSKITTGNKNICVFCEMKRLRRSFVDYPVNVRYNERINM